MRPTEAELREMLRRRAGELAMASEPDDAIVRRAARRKTRNVALAIAAALALAGLVSLPVSPTRYVGDLWRVGVRPHAHEHRHERARLEPRDVRDLRARRQVASSSGSRTPSSARNGRGANAHDCLNS